MPKDTTELAGTPPSFRRVEVLCLLVFPATTAWLFCRLWEPMRSSWAMTFGSLVAGWLAADLLSGATHWFFDTWFSPDTPVIGRAFVRAFREHHVDPTAICRHDFVETNGSNLLGGSFFMVLGLWPRTGSALGAYAASTLLFTGLFVSVTGQVHKWAHSGEAPALVGWLQRAGVLLSPQAHALHHAAPFARAYCITSGWLNGALDRLGFFGAVERAVRAATGARPRREPALHSEP